MIGIALAHVPDKESRGTGHQGVVYTRPWAVNLVLDLAGYVPTANLVDAIAIEPSAGSGNFLVAMASRLLASCRLHNRGVDECRYSIIGYELNPESAEQARRKIVNALLEGSVSIGLAEALANAWIRVGDFLLEPPACDSADFVLGNPPYVRLENLSSETAGKYRRNHSALTGRTNLYIAFFEASLRILRPNGVCAFICADRWMLNQQGSRLRQMVTSGYAVEAVIEMHRADAFESQVSAYPAVTVIRRKNQGPAVVAKLNGRIEPTAGSEVAQVINNLRNGDVPTIVPLGLRTTRTAGWFRGADPWIRASAAGQSLLKRLEDRFPSLESRETGTRVNIGVATGADDIYVTTEPELVERCRLLPIAMAGDAANSRLSWSGHYLVNPWDDQGLVDLSDYPELQTYFDIHERRLRDRYVGRTNPETWYRTIDRVRPGLLREPKLYIPDIKDRLCPVLDEGATYPHHNLYVLRSDCWDLAVLGGLLISDVARFFMQSFGVQIRGGYFRHQAQYLRKIRVPYPSEIPDMQARLLADAFHSRDRELATEVALALYGIDRIPGAEWEANCQEPSRVAIEMGQTILADKRKSPMKYPPT